jgi:hypothetical protein
LHEQFPTQAVAWALLSQPIGSAMTAITRQARRAIAESRWTRIEALVRADFPAGLEWAGAFAALLLAVGAIAFFNAYFGAGTEPDSLLAPDAASPPAGVAAANAGSAAAKGGEVVFTATEDGVWLRLYQEGGERLAERTLTQGETIAVPAGASDPRINTGRPDALAITIAGKSVARLSDKPETLAGTPVSAAALLARADVAAGTAAPAPTSSAPRRAARRNTNAPTARPDAPAATEAAQPQPEPAAQPSAAAESGDSPAN